MTLLEKVWTRSDRIFAMANALGRDLYSGDTGGEITPQELRGKVIGCLFCRHAADCGVLLETTERLSSPPTYCRNRVFLEQLAKH